MVLWMNKCLCVCDASSIISSANGKYYYSLRHGFMQDVVTSFAYEHIYIFRNTAFYSAKTQQDYTNHLEKRVFQTILRREKVNQVQLSNAHKLFPRKKGYNPQVCLCRNSNYASSSFMQIQ